MDTAAFSATYAESRTRLIQKTQEVGGRISNYRHPTESGRDGGPLYVDVAVLGDPQAPKSVVSVCGVHGPEGLAGAAIIQAALESGLESRVAKNMNVIIIHAINPWGMAHLRRTTERNVDLNRNFLNFSAPLPENEFYHLLHDKICSENLESNSAAFDSDSIFGESLATRSARVDAILRGQYDYCDGVGFGGYTEEWSNNILTHIVSDHLKSSRDIAIIDWHTGVGAFAEAVPMCFQDKDLDAISALSAWHRADVAAFAEKFPDGIAPQFTGLLVKGFERLLSKKRVYALVVEFGTRLNIDVMRALMIDRWLTFYGGRYPIDAERLKAEVSECFCPSDSSWRGLVLSKGQELLDNTINGLRRL